MDLPSLVLACSNNLARIVDGIRLAKVPARSRVDQGVQVGHFPIAIEKGGVAASPTPGRATDDLPGLVHAISPITLCA